MAQIRCTIISGFQAQNLTALLYNCLSTFGKIGQITNKLHSRTPTFIVSFHDTQNATDIVDTLDGQYVEVRLLLHFHNSA